MLLICLYFAGICPRGSERHLKRSPSSWCASFEDWRPPCAATYRPPGQTLFAYVRNLKLWANLSNNCCRACDLHSAIGFVQGLPCAHQPHSRYSFFLFVNHQRRIFVYSVCRTSQHSLHIFAVSSASVDILISNTSHPLAATGCLATTASERAHS